MSIVEVGLALVEAVEGAQAKTLSKRQALSRMRDAAIPQGTQFGIGYRTSFSEAPTPTYQVKPVAPRVDVATPVTFTPDQPIVGEQQQYQNLVTKPILTQTTPAEIAQAEPTRMVMQARQPMRRVAVRKPVRRAAARKPIRRIVRKPARRVTRRATRRYF